ncbi:hypothetical protein ASPSYDRAFT_50866 [Aspergillus sydowii CBS 593.65]|uniref:Zn(2)-C6 fungal-type domain-containing protein n=1 Tax=Aspergillus sydowii CBS 593.65 TaxID=1036612 RepID=A0A1L9T1S6_9EURO|nr:uncharacterized protein ASPSYDRAFT_50866 [Aspergillus sydowii CBS 593.65]OJJ53367.1 hypothetical protein ASPSYDRAFT_50866 [Aspergillus sydowii CBS 593.65]
MPPKISGERPKRRRRVYACDSCYRKKIKCDGTLPKCDWCHHHSIPCTYARNEDLGRSRKTPNTKLKTPPTPDVSTPVEQEQVQDLSRPAYPTPGPQAVAPQGFGATICFAGQSLGNIGGFNGLPVFSASGIEWIKARTGEEVTLDWYRTLPLQAPPRGSPQHLPLPDIGLLRQLLENYQRTIFYRMFPVINAKCFEYTIRAAYNDELSEISPGPASARACIFAFVALSSFIAGAGTESTITYTDKFAQEVYDLLPEVISESVTLDGLQAILMLSFCCQAVSADILRIELLLSSAARYVFHLKGNICPKPTDGDGDPLLARLHVRNLFWISFMFDKILGLRTGLPPLFDTTSCDLTLPSPGNDPAFTTLIRLCIVQAEIYRGLYCVPALNKSDAELLATIRTLDNSLEDWWSTVRVFSSDGYPDSIMADFLFGMQYHYCMSAIHQTSSRCTAWVLNQDTRAAGSSLAVSISAGRSLLNKFLDAKLHLLGHHLMFCLPEITVSTIHVFSNILMNPLEISSATDLNLMRSALAHLRKHLWQQAPESFTVQVRLVESFMADLQRLAECAIRKACAEAKAGLEG